MKITKGIVLAIAILLSSAVISKAQDKVNVKSPMTSQERQQWRNTLDAYDYAGIAKAYADYMIAHGRDVYGKVHSPLFMTVLNRKTGKPFRAPYPHVIAKPYAPGLRRDHKMRPYDRTYVGSNPIQDIPLYGLLYRLSEITGQKRYGEEADKSIAWFLENGWSQKTGLPGWGSHMYYHVKKDIAIFGGSNNPNGGYGGHEYNFVWPYWEQNPEALKRFAHGVWNGHIKNKKTGHFNRHSNQNGGGMEFPQTGSCFMEVWAREYGRSGDAQMKTAIQTLLKLFRSMRHPRTGAMAWCTAEGADRREVSTPIHNLFMATTLQDAAGHIQKRDPALAEDLRKFVRFIDDEYLSNDYDKILDTAGKGILTWYTIAERTCMAKGFTPPPDGVDASVGFPLSGPDGQPTASLCYLTPWFPGRSYAGFSLLLRDRYERCDQKHKPTYRQALLDTANIYMTICPEVQFAQYPDNIADVVELLRYVYKITDNAAYLHRADQIMRLGIRMFFDDTSPLPKITNFDNWYESSAKNESSVEILRQMLELSLDLKALPESKRSAPKVVAQKSNGSWHAKLDSSTRDMIFRYGPENQHELYLSQTKDAGTWQINLSDTITRIPTAGEADKINGRMEEFTGKGHTAASIAYGGFKDVPCQVTLVIRNTGKKSTRVQVKAILHDTYHDNGQVETEKKLKPGQQESFILTAPSKKWIRRLFITSDKKNADLSIKQFAFAMIPRNNLTPGSLVAGYVSADELKIIYKTGKASPRINYAVEQVRVACNEVSAKGTVFVSVQGVGKADNLKPEGFRLKSLSNGSVEVVGADQSGVLYGCLELADRIRAAGAIPADLDLIDAPEFKLRGPCIGMQKLQKDPYGGHYQWPYTPKNFPFFYDKEQWREYLDFLVGIRMNSLYLWNGHPFASLVQLEDYPEALEVSPETLKKNRETMYWLTSECDKRGIWLIQMFYNIHLPKGLGIGTSLSRSQPKAADYTRKSIAKFVEEYPNVGLLVCLGEALSGKEAQVEWFTETIIPGVKDGLKARGQIELPPIVVRGHHIVEYGSHKDVLSKGLKLYPNLFSMVKYNGESLTSETPRGKYQQYHKDMAKYSGTHMANVHLLSNLEPFRYADFSFIWNSCKAIRDRLDGNGLHLYPLAYWDWPNTPDTAEITQIQRDHLWFEIWARYCWKLDRNPAVEHEYWIGRLTEIYGDRKAADGIYQAYDASGECAPRLLRRFGITGGNRQCLELGMRLEQLTDPKKFRVWQELYDSDSPLGETITQYIAKEYANKPHVGETPPQIIEEVLAFAAKAVEQIEMAAPHVKKNKEEFARLRNDIHCIAVMSKSYCAKVRAAMMVHRYRHSKDAGYMNKALPYLEESLRHYKKLEELTRDVYRYSNAFHGRQKIPWNKVYHWSHLIDDYEKELADFKKKVAALDGKTPTNKGINKTNAKPWLAAKFKLLTKGVETYKVKKGAKVFTDRNYRINDIAPQLVGLTGMRFSHQKAKKGGIIKIDFEVAEPVKVLVGYFDSTKKEWLQVPMLEHVAHANDRGGLDTVLENVAEIGDANLKLPRVNVHAFKYDKGRHTLEMIGTGSYVILGVVPVWNKSHLGR